MNAATLNHQLSNIKHLSNIIVMRDDTELTINDIKGSYESYYDFLIVAGCEPTKAHKEANKDVQEMIWSLEEMADAEEFEKVLAGDAPPPWEVIK